MSAGKLEKTVLNMERRLKEEFQQEIKQQMAMFSSRLLAVEMKLKGSDLTLNFGDKESEINDIIEESLDRPEEDTSPHSVINVTPRHAAVLPETDTDAAKVQPVLENTLVKPEKDEPKQEDALEEPVSFMETAWNLVLVIGLTNSGCLDMTIACLLLLCSAGMQITFSVILLGKDFLGDPFREQIGIAKDWRRSVAHDHKHMDLAQTSLVSRVCSGDGKLILSTDQASLLSQINAFLGLENNDFELPWLQPGVLLCMLCILLWCLYLCNELRAVFFSLEAVSFLPRGKSTILKNGRFLQMSHGRFYAYCVMRLARLTIAVALLYAGVLWLAGTTSITDLILNAVALSAILEVDEMFFVALMPKKIQINIQDLEALKMTYSNFRSQSESVVLFIIITGLMIWPYLAHVGPLAADMLEVKRQYCFGNQDFVVGLNAQQQVTIGLKTNPFPVVDENSLTQFAVEDWILKPAGSVSNYILFRETVGSFQEWLGMSIGTYAAYESNCEDWSDAFLGNETPEAWQEPYRSHWYSTAYSVNMDASSTCSDMKAKCDDPRSGLLRFMCGHTCGCSWPYSNPWYRVASHGCSQQCIRDMEEDTLQMACEDVDISISPYKEIWSQFWDHYRAVVNALAGEVPQRVEERVQNLTREGCAGFLHVGWGEDMILNGLFCEGSHIFYRGLANLCPISCGCAVADPLPSHCPQSCKGCKDAEEFPAQGLVTNCAQARDAGLCEAYPEEALALCAETCELCHLVPTLGGNAST